MTPRKSLYRLVTAIPRKRATFSNYFQCAHTNTCQSYTCAFQAENGECNMYVFYLANNEPYTHRLLVWYLLRAKTSVRTHRELTLRSVYLATPFYLLIYFYTAIFPDLITLFTANSLRSKFEDPENFIYDLHSVVCINVINKYIRTRLSAETARELYKRETGIFADSKRGTVFSWSRGFHVESNGKKPSITKKINFFYLQNTYMLRIYYFVLVWVVNTTKAYSLIS